MYIVDMVRLKYYALNSPMKKKKKKVWEVDLFQNEHNKRTKYKLK